MFQQIADLYDDKFTDLNAKLIELIEPVLLILVGAFIFFVLWAMFTPLFIIGGGIMCWLAEIEV